MNYEFFPGGTAICHSGDKGTKVYLVASGKCEIWGLK